MNRIEAEKMARRRRTTEEIARALDRSGLSRKAFALKMHRVPSEVTRWLSGNHNFSSDLLAEISFVLGVPISGSDDMDFIAPEKSQVDGYACNHPAMLEDSGAGSLMCCVEIPRDAVCSLKSAARERGLSLRGYVETVLVRAAAESKPAAADFCGIWDAAFPDVDELRGARTANTFVEL